MVPVLMVLWVLVMMVVILSSITFTSASTFKIADLRSSGISLRIFWGAGPSEVFRVTFYVINHLFVVVFGCCPHDKPKS